MGANEREPELRQPEDAIEDLTPDEEATESVHGGAVDAYLKIGSAETESLNFTVQNKIT